MKEVNPMNSKLMFVLTAMLLLANSVFASEAEEIARQEMPPTMDRMKVQRLDPYQVTGIHQRATTEELSFFFTQGERSEVTIGVNAFRLFGKRADTFDGYRSLPWWLRNVQLSLTVPAENSNGDDASFELKWGLYRKAHKWDEYWDPLFHVDFPENISGITENWLDERSTELIFASIEVDSFLLAEGNDGFSFSFAGSRVAGEWQRFSGTLIGSHHLGGWLATLNGSFMSVSDDFGAQASGQISREFWPYRWKYGGLTTALTGSADYVHEWDWSTTASVAFPILEEARFLLAFSVSNEENRFLTGFTYQFLPKEPF